MSVKWQEKVGGKGQKAVHAKLEELLELWLRFLGNPKPERKGATCTLANLDPLEQLFPQIRFGTLTLNGTYETGFISYRKGLALVENPGDWTTVPSASADPEKLPLSQRYYRGGLRCKGRNIGILISGLPWQGDLAISCALGLWLGLLTRTDIEQITMEIQENTVERFVGFCDKEEETAA